ncbi:MAG: Lrp/AsnC ligand binding domain-containing protein [Acidobacteriota bacterium]|jgi:uncharacterized protein with GYD domain
MQGVLLLKVAQGRDSYAQTQKIATEARKLPGVTDSFSVLGRYDNVVFIEAKDFQTLRQYARRVASLEGIKASETLCEAD